MGQMNIIGKKSFQDINVVEAAKERLRYLFQSYDKVIVNFSGGKDSNAMLYVTIEVARELDKLPVEVVYCDHEIEGKGTFDLIQAVGEMSEVNLVRYCLPVKLRNATSQYAPHWYAWHPQEKDLWITEMPEDAVTELEGYVFEYDPTYEHPDGLPFKANGVKKCSTFQDIVDLHNQKYRRKGMTAISLVGIRAEESLARYTIMTRKKDECYISSGADTAYPIYDWMASDVWKYIKETKLPYNTEYDLMNRTEQYNQLKKQRVGSIFGEESLRTLDHWRLFYGDYWHRILDRAEGVKTAWRYCNEGLYTGCKVEKDPTMPWKQYAQILLNDMPIKTRKMISTNMNKIIKWHSYQTDHIITDEDKDSCPLTGISWEFLARIAIRGDVKERYLQLCPNMAKKARKRAKMTRDESVLKYGTERYKRKYYESKRKK